MTVRSWERLRIDKEHARAGCHTDWIRNMSRGFGSGKVAKLPAMFEDLHSVFNIHIQINKLVKAVSAAMTSPWVDGDKKMMS